MALDHSWLKEFAPFAYVPKSVVTVGRSSSSSSSKKRKLQQHLSATVDPTVVTKKDYQDVCGTDFDDLNVANRLAKTAFLYPKLVEVIDDFAPLVDDIVSYQLFIHQTATKTTACISNTTISCMAVMNFSFVIDVDLCTALFIV